MFDDHKLIAKYKQNHKPHNMYLPAYFFLLFSMQSLRCGFTYV